MKHLMDAILALSDEDLERGLRDVFQIEDPNFEDLGLSFKIRKTLRDDWGFGSDDRINDPDFGSGDSNFYQIWFTRWNVEGQRVDKLSYGGNPLKGGFDDVRRFNRHLARTALWVSVGYPLLAEAYEPGMDAFEWLQIREDYSGVLRKKKA